MHMLPHRLPGSKQELSDDLVVSILIDRSLLLEAGKAVLLIITQEEAAALLLYLRRNSRKFQTGGGQ